MKYFEDPPLDSSHYRVISHELLHGSRSRAVIMAYSLADGHRFIRRHVFICTVVFKSHVDCPNRRNTHSIPTDPNCPLCAIGTPNNTPCVVVINTAPEKMLSYLTVKCNSNTKRLRIWTSFSTCFLYIGIAVLRTYVQNFYHSVHNIGM
jgi:hypothetical protein